MKKYTGKAKPSMKERDKSPTDAALRFLSHKARTKREVERYLDEQEYGEYEVYAAVSRLEELGYINDRNYTQEFIRTRLNTKPISRQKLYDQLIAHEIPREMVEEELAELDDETEKENALEIAGKFIAQFEGRDDMEKRVMSRLLNRGFSYEHSRLAYEQALRDMEEE